MTKISRPHTLAAVILGCGVGFVAAARPTPAAPADAAHVHPATERETAEGLKRKVPEVRFDGVLLEDVFEFLRDLNGMNFVADWKRLEAAGLTQEKPINASSKGIPLADLLTQVLDNAADPKHPVKWANIGGIILASTPAGLEAYEAAAKAVAPDKLDEPSRTLLDRPIPEVKFNKVALRDAVDFMKDVSGAPVDVDWKALDAAGVDRNAEVTLRLRAVTFGQAMRLILLSVTEKTALHLSAKDGKIQITADTPKK